MADLGEEKKVTGVFGGVEANNQKEKADIFGGVNFENNNQKIQNASKNLPTKAGFWSKFKNFWLQDVDWNKEIKVELTPYQQKVEDEINEYLHQEVTFNKIHNFLFQEVSFGKSKKASL